MGTVRISTLRFAGMIATVALVSACAGTDQPASSRQAPAVQHAAAPAPIVGKILTHATLKEPMPTVASMATARTVVAIVQGRITKVTWEHEGTLAKTAYLVAVERTFKGQVPSEVLVREDGGYLSAADVQQANRDKFLSSAGPQSGFVDVSFEGASHPEVGDTVVLFLEPDPNPGHEGSYVLAGSSFGRFVLRDTTYVRAAVEQGWDSGLSLTSLKTLLEG